MNEAILCPWCGKKNDGHIGIDQAENPSPGDVGICWSCANISVFDRSPLGALIQRKPTQEEDQEFSSDESIQVAIRAIKNSHSPFDAAFRYEETKNK